MKLLEHPWSRQLDEFWPKELHRDKPAFGAINGAKHCARILARAQCQAQLNVSNIDELCCLRISQSQ